MKEQSQKIIQHYANSDQVFKSHNISAGHHL